ncbi:MAG: hypothetical protein R3C01_12060 [Planctomycetaceae bacterium]
MLGIDWGETSFGAVWGGREGATLRVRQVLRWTLPNATGDGAEPSVTGEWLKQQCATLGGEVGPVHVVLPRQSIATRRLDLPVVPDDELPEIVRFQAATKSSRPLGDLSIDFVPFPTMHEATSRSVLLATIDRERMDAIRAAVEGAGLTLGSVGVSPIGVAELAARYESMQGEDVQQATLVVYKDGPRIEISILHRLRLLFSHHTVQEQEDERSLRSTMTEITRSSVVLSQTSPGVEIGRVCLVGDTASLVQLEVSLRDRFGGQLDVVDPTRLPGLLCDGTVSRDTLASAAPAFGVLLGLDDRVIDAINFLNPRKTPPKRNEMKRRAVLIGGGVAAVGLLGGGGMWMYGNSLAGEIDTLTRRQSGMQQSLAAGEGTMKDHELVSGWLRGAVDPLDEIDRFNRLLPGGDRVLIIESHVFSGSQDAISRVTAIGMARTQRDIEDLNQRFNEQGYRVKPKVPGPNKLNPDYPFRFDLDIERLQEAPAKEQP